MHLDRENAQLGTKYGVHCRLTMELMIGTTCLYSNFDPNHPLVVKLKKKHFSFSVGEFLKVTSQRRHVLKILATFGQPWAPTH